MGRRFSSETEVARDIEDFLFQARLVKRRPHPRIHFLIRSGPEEEASLRTLPGPPGFVEAVFPQGRFEQPALFAVMFPDIAQMGFVRARFEDVLQDGLVEVRGPEILMTLDAGENPQAFRRPAGDKPGFEAGGKGLGEGSDRKSVV